MPALRTTPTARTLRVRRFVSAAACAAAFACCACTADAHHSGLYDEQDVVTLEGTIAAIHWVNPHVRLELEVPAAGAAPAAPDGAPAAGGDVERWEIEGTSVNALERWGIEPDTFRVGERIVVKGPRSRFGRNAMVGATVERADGVIVILWPNIAARLGLAETGVAGLFPAPAAPAAGAAPGAEPLGIFRIWTPRGRPPAQELPLTDRARAKLADYDPLEDDPALRCEPPGMPVMLDTPYPIELVDHGEEIVMRFEEWDGVRTIYMNPGAGPPIQEHSPKGVSFGRWEANRTKLAIFTTYINYPYVDDLGTPQSDAVTVLERYTLDADETRLDWEVTITDPAMFTTPIVRRGYMAYEAGETIKPYNCTLP